MSSYESMDMIECRSMQKEDKKENQKETKKTT
jgi:hypothetical protein